MDRCNPENAAEFCILNPKTECAAQEDNYFTMFVPTISATRVAGLCGLHKYQTQDEVIYDLFCKDKTVEPTIRALEASLGLQSFQALKESVFRDSNVKNIVYSAIETAKHGHLPSALDSAEQNTKTLLTMRYAHIPSDVRDRLASEAKSEVRMKRGLNNENKILNTYEVDNNVQVIERNTKTLKMDFPTFKLVGRTDGWVAAHNRIVDSKDRTRYFPEVPIYDEIQLRTYMRMSGATESELIERFPDKPTRTTKFMNDPVQWAIIESALETAVAKMNEILKTPSELELIVRKNTVKTNGGAVLQQAPPVGTWG
jgi:hypothetical protein